jgi:hypothetical protein
MATIVIIAVLAFGTTAIIIVRSVTIYYVIIIVRVNIVVEHILHQRSKIDFEVGVRVALARKRGRRRRQWAISVKK